jgi:DNA replication protein DnaC
MGLSLVNPNTPAERVWNDVVPADFRAAELSGLEPDVEADLRAWVSSLGCTPDDAQTQGNNLVIAGPVGAGKTYAGFAVCRELYFVGHSKRGRVVPVGFRFWLQNDLMRDLRLHEEETLQTVDRTSVLFIDDLGSMRETPWVLDQVYGVLDHRRRNRRPVMTTTNLTLDQLEAYLGEGAFSRLVRGSLVIEMRAADRRG